MLDKIQKHLRNCDIYARRLNSVSNLRHALVDMFEALIDFWVEAVKILRKHPVGMLGMHIPLTDSRRFLTLTPAKRTSWRWMQPGRA